MITIDRTCSDAPSKDLALRRGDPFEGKLYINAGPIIEVRSTSGGVSPVVETLDNPCWLKVDDIVRLAAPGKDNNLQTGCYAVTDVDDNSVTLAYMSGDEVDEATCGWLTKPANLNGYSGSGYIASKAPLLPNISGVYGSVMAGDSNIIVTGYHDITVGDLVSLNGSGIEDACVLAVYRQQSDPAMQLSAMAPVVGTSTSCDCDDVVEITPINSNTSVLLVDQRASQTVALDAPGQISRKPGQLASIKVFVPEDSTPECGVLCFQTEDREKLDTFPLPTQGLCPQNVSFCIGYYEIRLNLGPEPSDRYPQSPLWSKAIAKGPVYLQS